MVSEIGGPAIYMQNGFHVHMVRSRTGFKDNHYHEYSVYSGPNIELPGGYHIHFVNFKTSVADGHIHIFTGYDQATMTENILY
jgi:hypothetical protein